jgi:hypothetical protein
MNDTPVKQPTIGRALLPLIMIPITVIIDIILLVVGFIIDKAVYEPKPDVPSFMFPFFTIVFGFIALVVSIIALIIMIVLICVGLSKVRRANE